MCILCVSSLYAPHLRVILGGNSAAGNELKCGRNLLEKATHKVLSSSQSGLLSQEGKWLIQWPNLKVFQGLRLNSCGLMRIDDMSSV